jgi:hypothetical protein
MLIRHLATSSATPCQPSNGYAAAIGLFVGERREWRISLKLGEISRPELKSMPFSRLFIVIQGLLNRDQLGSHRPSGRFRSYPELT